MADAGRVLIIPKGAYNSETVYEPLDLVFYDHKSWVARKNNVGIVPSEASEEYWYKLVDMDVTTSLDETVEGKVLDATAGKVLKGLIDETRTDLSEEIESAKTAIDEEIVEVQTGLEEAIDEKIAKSDALSKEEIAASTDLTGKVPSAAAFSQLNSELVNFTKIKMVEHGSLLSYIDSCSEEYFAIYSSNLLTDIPVKGVMIGFVVNLNNYDLAVVMLFRANGEHYSNRKLNGVWQGWVKYSYTNV